MPEDAPRLGGTEHALSVVHMNNVIPPTLRALILDIDGTLIDSNDAHTYAWMDALEEFGIRLSYDTLRPYIGMGGDKILPDLADISADSELGRKISERRSAIFRETYLPSLQAFPGTRQLLLSLKKKGLQLAIASSSSQKDLVELLARAGIADILALNQTSSNDAEKSKPDPDIVIAALKKLSLAPFQVLMIGDTPYDIEAAKRAGIHTLAFRCGGYWHDKDFSGASAIYDGPWDLLEHWLRSLHVSTAELLAI